MIMDNIAVMTFVAKMRHEIGEARGRLGPLSEDIEHKFEILEDDLNR